MPPKANKVNGSKPRSSANPAAKPKGAAKPAQKAAATPKAKATAMATTTKTTRTVTTTVTTTHSMAGTPVKATKPRTAPKSKAAASPKVKEATAAKDAGSVTKAAAKHKTGPKTMTERKSQPTPKPKAPKAPKTVFDVLFRSGTRLAPIHPHAEPAAAGGDGVLASALPRGTGVVSLAQSDVFIWRLAASLQSKLAPTNLPAPMQASDALRTIGAQSRAVDALLTMAAAWSPARKWPTRAWNRISVDHCPLFGTGHHAVEPSGAKTCFVLVPKAQLAALSNEAKSGVQIPISKGVIPPGPEIHTVLQIFHAMHTKKWNMVLLMDETNFVAVYKDGATLTLSSPMSITKPHMISLVGAMLELVRLGRHKLPDGTGAPKAPTPKPRTKQTAKCTGRGGGRASSSAGRHAPSTSDAEDWYHADDIWHEAATQLYASDDDYDYSYGGSGDWYGDDGEDGWGQAAAGHDSSDEDNDMHSGPGEWHGDSDHDGWGQPSASYDSSDNNGHDSDETVRGDDEFSGWGGRYDSGPEPMSGIEEGAMRSTSSDEEENVW